MATTRQKHRRSARGRQHANAPQNYWHRRASEVRFGRYQWRALATRGKARDLILDATVKALDWSEDANNVLTGSITVQRATSGPNLVVGDKVKVQWSPWGQDQWHTLWTMFLSQPEYQIGDQQFVYQLEDELSRAAKSKMTLKFRTGKAHPNGWRADDAIRHICEKADIEVGRIPRMKYRAKKLNFIQQAPTMMLSAILLHERRKSGHRYFLRWIGGRLSIVPFQRSRDLLAMGDFISSGTLQEAQQDNFATVLEVVATKRKGKHRKERLRTIVESKKGIERYGRIRKTVHAPHADSISELRKFGKRDLARRGRPKRDLNFTHQGIPTVRRGDALRLTIPEAAIDGEIVFISEVSHNVQPGDYTMEITVSFTDPYVDKRKKSTKAKREANQRKRGRSADDKRSEKPKPRKRSQRT